MWLEEHEPWGTPDVKVTAFDRESWTLTLIFLFTSKLLIILANSGSIPLKLSYLGLNLSYMGLILSYMGLNLGYMGHKLSYFGLKLSYMGIKLRLTENH